MRIEPRQRRERARRSRVQRAITVVDQVHDLIRQIRARRRGGSSPFLDSVERQSRDMALWVANNDWVTDAQLRALDNWQSAVLRTYNRPDIRWERRTSVYVPPPDDLPLEFEDYLYDDEAGMLVGPEDW